MKILMQYSKSTKNTHMYSNDASDADIPTLYIKKVAMEKNPPLEIEVSVAEFGEG
jgi:hypothetical protein